MSDWESKLGSSAVARTIAARHSVKKLASSPLAPAEDTRTLLEGLCDVAGQSPFHYRSAAQYRAYYGGKPDSIVPWRMHILDQANCRKLRSDWDDESIDGAKLSDMLWSALGLVLVTWLPDGEAQQDELSFEPSIENMEHIAAAGAACQNLLLTATDLGLDSYWSSGGILRTEAQLKRLGVNPAEIVIGALFVFASEQEQPSPDTVRLVYSNLRKNRGEGANWSRIVEL